MSSTPAHASAVTLADLHAANIARQAECFPDQLPDLSFRGNELAGEAGEAVEALMLHAAELGRLAGRASNLIKKLERERYGWRGSRASKEALAQELADVVICADLCAVTASIDLAGAVVDKFNATSLAQGLATMLAAKAPARVSLAGFVSALDIASLKADSPEDASALRAAADLVQNYDVEIGAALVSGAGSWAAWSETEVDSDPSDPLCGHAEVWRVGWWRRGSAHADIEHEMGGPDGERRARALAAALNGLHAAQPAPPAPASVEGEESGPVKRERAACAYLAECHTGLWDNATAEAIATAIRERGRRGDDGVLVSPEAWAAVQPVWLLLRHGKALPDDLAERIRAADLRASAPPEVETLESIARWAEETFGPIRPERIVGRAGEEMDELRAEPERVDEAADVVICLARYPGLGAAINRKMKVNRGRRWRLMGDGTGYHIKDGSPADLPTSAPPEVRHG